MATGAGGDLKLLLQLLLKLLRLRLPVAPPRPSRRYLSASAAFAPRMTPYPLA